MPRLFLMRLQKLLGILQYWTGNFPNCPEKQQRCFFSFLVKWQFYILQFYWKTILPQLLFLKFCKVPQTCYFSERVLITASETVSLRS